MRYSIFEKYTLLYYPLEDHMSNLVNKASAKFYQGALVKDQNNNKYFHSQDLITAYTYFDLSKDFSVGFQYKYNSGGAEDWNHIFTFGVHAKEWRDDKPYYSISIDAPRSGSNAFYQVTQAFASAWHTYEITKENNVIRIFIDHQLKSQFSASLYGVNGLYFGGSGSMRVQDFNIKKFVVNIGTFNFTNRRFIYKSIDKSAYGKRN